MNANYYLCKSREGVVHIATMHSYEEERAPPVDETLCGETNYFEPTTETVNCVGCIAAEGEVEE